MRSITYRRTLTALETRLKSEGCTFTSVSAESLDHLVERADALADAPWAIFHVIGLCREHGLWHMRLARRPGHPPGYWSVNPLGETA